MIYYASVNDDGEYEWSWWDDQSIKITYGISSQSPYLKVWETLIEEETNKPVRYECYIHRDKMQSSVDVAGKKVLIHRTAITTVDDAASVVEAFGTLCKPVLPLSSAQDICDRLAEYEKCKTLECFSIIIHKHATLETPGSFATALTDDKGTARYLVFIRVCGSTSKGDLRQLLVITHYATLPMSISSLTC